MTTPEATQPYAQPSPPSSEAGLIAPSTSSALAVAALVVGIVAFVSGLAPVWGVLAGGIAVALGAIALAKRQNKVLALIGLALGAIAALASLVTTFALVVALANGGSPNAVGVATTEANPSPSPSQTTEPAEAIVEPAEEEPAAPTTTVSQANAERSAESYLNFAGFSRAGLIKQLEYEGYSTEDSAHGVDAVGADWNEQAARSAKAYLDFTSFSRSGLIDQLVFEGFSVEEAEFGANAVGL